MLNIAERAVARLEMDNDAVRFTARFGGVSQSVVVPMAAVLADLCPRDRAGHGAAAGPAGGRAAARSMRMRRRRRLVFPERPPTTPPEADPPKRGAHLRIVK